MAKDKDSQEQDAPRRASDRGRNQEDAEICGSPKRQGFSVGALRVWMQNRRNFELEG